MMQTRNPVKSVYQAILRSPENLVFEETVLSHPLRSDEIRVETLLTAVSLGTECAAFRGDPPLRPSVAYPRLMGYCNVGSIAEVGHSVKGLSIGDRVFTHFPHQSGFQCGGERVLVTVPQNVADEEASLSYLAQLGLAALQKICFLPGETVAIVGLGPIGLACVGIVRALGGRPVAIGRGEQRLSIARIMGAEHAIDASSIEVADGLVNLPEKIDAVVNTANSWSAWRASLEIARFQTRIAVLGFPGRTEGAPSFNPLDSSRFYEKQLIIAAVGKTGDSESDELSCRLKLNMATVMRMLMDKTLVLSPLVTHRVSWRELGNVYKKVVAGDKSVIGAVIDWRVLQ
jgi:threonine dehydrogenase-like Zn-dependent dehydrogenase